MQEFTFTIQKDSKQPLYRQLYNYLVKEIKNGNLKENEKLPGKKALAQHLAISQSTVETAYEMLAAEGYTVAKPRSGFYVCRLETLQTAALPPEPQAAAKAEAPRQFKYSLLSGNIDTTVFPFGTWAKIVKEIVYNNRSILAYGDRKGDLELRENLTKYLHEFRGISCRPEQVIIGAGLEYLLHLVCRLLGERAVFALEDPGYTKTAKIFINNGGKIRFIPVAKDGMSLEALQNSDANVAYITPSHQFPLGVVMPVGKRLQMLNWAGKAPYRYIIEDDYDSEFRYNGAPIPALQGLDENGKVIYVGTFSRSIAPAFRLAYMVLPYPLLRKYEKLFDGYSSTVSRLDQQILREFIGGGHFGRHLNRVRNVYKQRRDALVTALQNSPLADRFQIIGENAGLHFLLQVNLPQTEEELVAKAAAADIQIVGLKNFCYRERKAAPVLVMGFADLTPEEAPQVVDTLVRAWQE